MRVAILFFSAAVLFGCVKGGYPETTLQLCLAGDDDFAVLRTMLKDAAKGSLAYGDRSRQSEAELKSLGAKEVESSFPLIDISLLNRRNQGITVSNLGLPANQVMIAHYPIDGTDRTAGLLNNSGNAGRS